jgi:hypothetical protein
MVLTLDNLATRYHCLPSEAMAKGSTFDLYVLDVSAKWSKRQQDISEGKTVEHTLTQDDMFKMIARARGEDDPS